MEITFIGFFEEILVLNGGKFEGTPFLLHPSQAFIVGSIFGWLRKDGTRRYRRAYIEMGKGNGKSPLAAGIGMYGLLVDGEPRAEVYAAATKVRKALEYQISKSTAIRPIKINVSQASMLCP